MPGSHGSKGGDPRSPDRCPRMPFFWGAGDIIRLFLGGDIISLFFWGGGYNTSIFLGDIIRLYEVYYLGSMFRPPISEHLLWTWALKGLLYQSS